MKSLNNNILNCPTLLTGMSHEVRTHMNAIVALSFLMSSDECAKKERDDFSQQILSSCEQLIGLFDSFLDTAIIETGDTRTNHQLHKLDTVFDELTTEFRGILLKDPQKNIELITEIQFGNSVEIKIDKARVSRILRCLFQNSVRTTKSGYIKVGYNLDINKANFYILDSGFGFFKNNEFFHTQNMNESLSQDCDTITALNISLTRTLIEMLGGSINIECNGISGTGVYFSIPAEIISGSNETSIKCVNSMIAI